MNVFGATAEGLMELSERVRESILSEAGPSALHRKIPATTVLAFDPSLIWVVESGKAYLEYVGRGVMTLETGHVVGPWMASAAPLSLVTKEVECELRGFDQQSISSLLEANPAKLALWCQFQGASLSRFFGEFAELKAMSSPPIPRHRSFKPGDVVLKEGDTGSEVFLLMEGELEVSVRGNSVGQIQKNEIFGALAALTRGTRTASVTATTPSVCMVFGKDEFRDFLRSNATLMEKLFEDFARALTDLNASIIKARNTKWQNLF